jgi:hypothetical protein
VCILNIPSPSTISCVVTSSPFDQRVPLKYALVGVNTKAGESIIFQLAIGILPISGP